MPKGNSEEINLRWKSSRGRCSVRSLISALCLGSFLLSACDVVSTPQARVNGNLARTHTPSLTSPVEPTLVYEQEVGKLEELKQQIEEKLKGLEPEEDPEFFEHPLGKMVVGTFCGLVISGFSLFCTGNKMIQTVAAVSGSGLGFSGGALGWVLDHRERKRLEKELVLVGTDLSSKKVLGTELWSDLAQVRWVKFPRLATDLPNARILNIHRDAELGRVGVVSSDDSQELVDIRMSFALFQNKSEQDLFTLQVVDASGHILFEQSIQYVSEALNALVVSGRKLRGPRKIVVEYAREEILDGTFNADDTILYLDELTEGVYEKITQTALKRLKEKYSLDPNGEFVILSLHEATQFLDPSKP